MSSSSAQHDEGEGASAPPASSDENESDSRCTSSSDTSATWTVLHVPGSTVAGATFNFTNSVVGAGAIGLGGAIAVSGGAVSIACIIFFGILTKLSLDMLIELTVKTDGANGSYEDLGRAAYGTAGRLAVKARHFAVGQTPKSRKWRVERIRNGPMGMVKSSPSSVFLPFYRFFSF